MKLKEHFSKGATTTIESLFWMPRSKSAFVNYSTGEALTDAMNRFHNSPFEGVRLVCRIRRADLSIDAKFEPRPAGDSRDGLSSGFKTSPETEKSARSFFKSQREDELNMDPPLAMKRFFIMKSLTREDIELSVQNGYWMTQDHNETTLNKAFKVRSNCLIHHQPSHLTQTAEDVYLIFSANRSGQYFGYARMRNTIEIPFPDSPPTKPAVQLLESPKSHEPEKLATPSTENAPAGAIFIDAYRGITFWEADIASKDDVSSALSSEMDSLKIYGDVAEPVKKKENNVSTPF